LAAFVGVAGWYRALTVVGIMMLEGLVGTTSSGDVLRVREVWQDNLEAEMSLIENIVEDFPLLAMDTEFPGASLPTDQYAVVVPPDVEPPRVLVINQLVGNGGLRVLFWQAERALDAALGAT
jgi:hypothetical protein